MTVYLLLELKDAPADYCNRVVHKANRLRTLKKEQFEDLFNREDVTVSAHKELAQ